MSQYVKVNGIKNLRKALERGLSAIRKQCDKAVWRTAQKAVRPIRRRVPVAFGELKNSVQAFPRGANNHPVTSVDAPHAGAVEVGSPPHKPNFERLLAWVKLRGLQHLGGGPRKRGPTAGYQVPRVGAMFAAHVRGGPGGQFSPTDAAEKIAMAISKGIEKRGTKPHWFVRESLGDIRQILDDEMKGVKAAAVAAAASASRSSSSSAGGSTKVGSTKAGSGSSGSAGTSGSSGSAGSAGSKSSGGRRSGAYRAPRMTPSMIARSKMTTAEREADDAKTTARNRQRAKENFSKNKAPSNRWGWGPKE